jgi:hypothetical protein
MATTKQREAARKNVKKAQAGAKQKQTLKARKLDIKGRSKMGKTDLKCAVARAK